MRDIYDTKIGIVTALHTIQETCKNHIDSGCCTCPLRVDCVADQPFICGIHSGDPEDWHINDIMNWRAFK